MANFDRRPRGRNNNRRNGRRHNGSRPSQVIKLNDQGRSFNHQRVRFNGNASKLFEKYNKLASEALASGDKILAENYFQHADHFARMMPPPEEMKTISEENKDEETTNVDESCIEDNTSQESDLNKLDGDNNTVVAKSSN
ncbi:MAG: DUF4167 domain-containing protein [Pelagibacteraceae bacterium]|nr:DUF4167 domain-containing protein [Pelagibacteraceae bacterium]MCI5078749.1 DUF4167 domain-containing protein [Pelagibacteraceae bacterium]